jgi:hypothetical protein
MKQWKLFDKNDDCHKSSIGNRDIYWMYSLSYDELCDMINEWFIGGVMTNKDKDITYIDEIITVKICDEDTFTHLYGRPINPVSIRIVCPTGAKFKTNDKDELLYDMKVQIYSIDDSSYGIWFKEIPMKTLRWLREEIKRHIDTQGVINGEKLLDLCESFGGVDKDYN